MPLFNNLNNTQESNAVFISLFSEFCEFSYIVVFVIFAVPTRAKEQFLWMQIARENTRSQLETKETIVPPICNVRFHEFYLEMPMG